MRRNKVQKQRRILTALLPFALALCMSRATAQEPPAAASSADPISATSRRIVSEIQENNEVMENLEYLSDLIGPRLTGTQNMTQASRWTMEMFRRYGLANVHLESWTIARAWHRGTAQGQIVNPAEHPLTLASAGWSPSTAGAVRGPVVYVSARRVEDLQPFQGKLKGAIVIVAEPEILPAPFEVPRSPLLSPMPQPPSPPGFPTQAFGRARDAFFKAQGVAAVLRDSGKDHALLNMGGVGGRSYDVGAVPTAFVTTEGYRQIWRLLKRGPVEVEVELKNSFSDKPVEVYNTVAEIRGRERPDEVVILGAHLDSWDLGTGTTDNGTGSMVVVEAARALQKLDLKPNRTIRFLLFSGEEQGLNGSRAYVEAHKAELGKISGVLVHDAGTGRVLSIGLQGNYQDREVLDRILAPLRDLGLSELSLRSSRSTDHASFNDAGVPGFFCVQDSAEYRKTHHSQSDTFDKVWKGDLVQGAQVLAVWAYDVAQWSDMLPRGPAPTTAGGSE
jgi:carboxypeptidase Q